MLAGEFFLFRRSLPAAMILQLQLVDCFYGIAAGLVIVTGIALIVYGLKWLFVFIPLCAALMANGL